MVLVGVGDRRPEEVGPGRDVVGQTWVGLPVVGPHGRVGRGVPRELRHGRRGPRDHDDAFLGHLQELHHPAAGELARHADDLRHPGGPAHHGADVRALGGREVARQVERLQVVDGQHHPAGVGQRHDAAGVVDDLCVQLPRHRCEHGLLGQDSPGLGTGVEVHHLHLEPLRQVRVGGLHGRRHGQVDLGELARHELVGDGAQHRGDRLLAPAHAAGYQPQQVDQQTVAHRSAPAASV